MVTGDWHVHRGWNTPFRASGGLPQAFIPMFSISILGEFQAVKWIFQRLIISSFGELQQVTGLLLFPYLVNCNRWLTYARGQNTLIRASGGLQSTRTTSRWVRFLKNVNDVYVVMYLFNYISEQVLWLYRWIKQAQSSNILSFPLSVCACVSCILYSTRHMFGQCASYVY